MIKFWKSAAKGKSGCPVRPPEKTAETCIDVKTLINTHYVNENKATEDIFEKKSKLSLTLHNILVEKKALTCFIKYMETIGQHLLVKCWLDLDKFKALNKNISENMNSKSMYEINRTQSFDMNGDSKYNNDHKRKCTDKQINYTVEDNQTKSLCSSSSCGNLFDQVISNTYKDPKNPIKISLTEEAVCLFKKYIALEAPYQLGIPDNVRKYVITNICNPEGEVKRDCFQPVLDYLYTKIEESHLNNFLSSAWCVKAQIDILTNGSLNLKDILYNETLLFYFTEYLEQESCRTLLEFVMAVIHFRDNLINQNANDEQAQSDAIVLYDKYFSLQATNPLGFPTETRLTIESEICREGGPVYSCFDSPFRIVFMTLSEYVKSFLESNLYYKYLSEMIHSVEYISPNHRSYSDCSSEFSVSTQNTLLAMGDPVFRRKKRNHSVPDMTIDSNQLYNADSLWKRNRNEGLNLGRVNSLGRFESKFEPDPDKKESVIKKMVSRFVPINTSKVEEEMAWQIAHMIVKDVTDLTMSPPDHENDL